MTELVFQYDRPNGVWKFVIEERLSESEIDAVIDALSQHFFVYHAWQKMNTEPTINIFYVHCYIISLTDLFSRRYAKRIANALGRQEFLFVEWLVGEDPIEQAYSRFGASGPFQKVPKKANPTRVMEV